VGNTSILDWATTAENNNRGFYIERSSDSRNFNEIGFVPGAGTSSKLNNYLFKDPMPVTGENFYRLRQVDFDGKFNYSAIQVTHFNRSKVNVYPTSFTSMINLKTGGEVGTFTVRDVVGRSLKKVEVNGENLITINVDALPPGIYFWKLNQQSGKLVKQ